MRTLLKRENQLFKEDRLKTVAKKTLTRLLHTVLLSLSIICLGTAAHGQGTASIVGTVTDPSGAVVQNAKISITNLENGFLRANHHFHGLGNARRRSFPTACTTSVWRSSNT